MFGHEIQNSLLIIFAKLQNGFHCVCHMPNIPKDYRGFNDLNRFLGDVVWRLRQLYYTAEMVSGTSWVLFWFIIAMNTLRTGSILVYPYMLLYTVRVTFPMYSVHEQNDLGSETAWSSFDSQESSTSFKLIWRWGIHCSSDDARICDCVKCWLREFSPVPTCLHCPQMVPFRKYCHIYGDCSDIG